MRLTIVESMIELGSVCFAWGYCSESTSKPLLMTATEGAGTRSNSPTVDWYDSSKISSLAPRRYLRQTDILFSLLVLKIAIPSIMVFKTLSSTSDFLFTVGFRVVTVL